jgi:transcriptional regulator with XRE-family HTH domain
VPLLRIKELRLARGLSQEKVAEALDRSISTVSRHETGREDSIDIGRLRIYARLYNCRVVDLFADAAEPTGDEADLLEIFRALPPEKRQTFIETLRLIASGLAA